ncbi:hypothetical protein AB0I72_04845 [Nocardiopsis sp. NPDC049922]|uniref:hypothetical protein n=1 Tax=Nocardiopsis sp. NPDC049922 TaxID=3155157 RepID=UPI0034051A72
MAVLAAIAVIAAALLLAETTLVYVALGLGAVSALLLVGAVIQGRFGGGGSNRERSGTDGLGKSSVPATTPAQYERSEEPGRVPAPAYAPVREVSSPVESGHGAGPVTEGAGPQEPESDVPRGETPEFAAWPVQDTAAPDPSPGERPTATETSEHDASPAPEVAAPPPIPPETAAEPAPEPPGEEDTPAPFSYRIPAFDRTVEDESPTVTLETPAPGETVPAAEATPETGDVPDASDVSDGATVAHEEPEPHTADGAPAADEDAPVPETASEDTRADDEAAPPSADDDTHATGVTAPEDAQDDASTGDAPTEPPGTARTTDDTGGEEPDPAR